MPSFVRKNIVTLTATFVANDGSQTQPSAARAILVYRDRSGAGHEDSVDLTYSSATGVWTGTWDSSASGEGVVNWMIYGYGELQAAQQGCFDVAANAANTV